MNTLLWFQRDLRINANPALNWALQQGKPVVAVYIHSPEEDAPWAAGAASCWWLQQSLKRLSADLLKLNINLLFFKGNSVETVAKIVNALKIDSVVWTSRVEPRRIECESRIEKSLARNNIEVRRFKDELLTAPDIFLTATNNTPYKAFTPFYKKLRRELNLSAFYTDDTVQTKTSIDSTLLATNVSSVDSLPLDKLNLVDNKNWHKKLDKNCQPGEQAAIEKLERFVDEALSCYATQRDIPSVDGTSKLSAHLHFGEVSPRQIVTALAPFIELEGGNIATAAEGFLRQLIWREFARYILWHFPHTSMLPMNSKYTQSFWKHNKVNLKKWQQGNTGITIVDAGMKELWETGNMHNRVRMLTASLLTKNLGIAWQEGARWFWDTLVDADLANNSMGWQWVAGCGVDAAPYFRVFNPETQAKKFDKQGSYVHRWLAERSSLTTKTIVDLATSRADALERYKNFIQIKAT